MLFWFSVIWSIPVSVLGQYVLQRISDHIRFKISMSDDGKVDEYERMWNEFTEEDENDVMGLSISFMMLQVIRFGISSIFQNTEGAESETDRDEHPVWQFGVLCGTAIVLAFVLFVLIRFIPCEEEEDDDSDQETEKGETSEGEDIGSELLGRWRLWYPSRWHDAFFFFGSLGDRQIFLCRFSWHAASFVPYTCSVAHRYGVNPRT